MLFAKRKRRSAKKKKHPTPHASSDESDQSTPTVKRTRTQAKNNIKNSKGQNSAGAKERG